MKDILADFEARIRGDKSIDPYLLYRGINAGIAKRDPRYLGRPLQWSTSMLDRWYKDITGANTGSSSHGASTASREVEGATLYDLLQKAAILMETDLWFYEGANQKAFKQHLFTSLRPLFYKTDQFDSRTREALTTFLSSSRPYMPKDIFASCVTLLGKEAVA